MAGFSETERRRIRSQLLRTGRERFTTAGLRKTSLEDLTRPAGIHKTSFYAFFANKEALYLELLAQEAPGVQERVVGPALAEADPATALRRFLHGMLHELEHNDVVRRLVAHPDELRAVAARVAPEPLRAKTAGLLPLLEFVEGAARRGELVDRDPHVVVGVLRAVTMLSLHREDIGEALYRPVLDLMVDLVATGLAAGADHREETT
jgi:AcrR family transcriptional regulator